MSRGSSFDAAPDGTVLIASRATGEVLRVDPTSDRLAVIADADPLGAPLDLVDVAAAGPSAVVATGTGILQVAADGARTELAAISGITALDVGSDGVVWVATAGQVLRVLPDGTVVPATPADQFGALTELTVTPDGTRAFVLEGAADKWAVYPVTAAGAGARVAGTLARSDSLLTGMPATSASTEAVESITTDGTSIWMSSSEYRRVVRFPVGGTITQVIDGVDPESVAVLGADLAVALTDTSAWTWRLERFTVAGAGRGRLVGLDPARPWSPDGVRADDAHLGTVRGAAALADGRTVFTTSAGLVREVGPDGLLSTRATLAPIATRGKVAVAPDGTAYVVTDAGTLAAVPAVGPATTLALDADITDVEVRPDGTVVVADRRGDRLLTVPPGGSTAVLATGLVDPSDLSLDGTDVLVADSGIRRVTAAGSVSTVLTGGAPGEVARTSEGVWTRPNDQGWVHQVLLPSGAMSPVRADLAAVTQVQAVAGDALLAGDGTVRLVTDPGLPPESEALAVGATGGSGRVLLDWDDDLVQSVDIRASRGTTPPADRWDGEVVGPGHTVLWIGGEVVQPGETWTFAIFPRRSVPVGANTSTTTIGAPTIVTATAQADATPPPEALDPQVWATHERVALNYRDPAGDDFSHSVVQMLPGDVPPQTPDQGVRLLDGRDGYPGFAEVPSPVRDQHYAFSVFTVDLHGNTTRWSTVAELDFQPPAQVADVVVTPSYRSVQITLTPPTDPDYRGITYAVGPGSAVPAPPTDPPLTGLPLGSGGLAMDSDYTVAIWTHDWNGNVSEPVVEHFRTPLDTTAPGPVTGLSAVGGDYRVDASWAPPTDPDVQNLQVTLVDTTTGGAGTTTTLAKNATSAGWSNRPGGHHFQVKVTATDVNGNVSDVAVAETDTNPDSNGPPPAIDPASVTVVPTSPTSVTISFPRPSVPDLRNIGYALTPVGADPGTATSFLPLPTSAATVTAKITLAQPSTAYQLVIHVWDLNGNRARTVVPAVKGEFSPSQLPPPSLVLASSTSDNALRVDWGTTYGSVPPTSWVVTATSGALTRSTTVSGSALTAGLKDLAGQRDWTVSVRGANVYGQGDPKYAAAPVRVNDTTAPANVTSLAASPSYDTQLISWVNPTAFDFDHVVVTRYGAVTTDKVVVYTGKATSVRATGLGGGKQYRFVVAAYDALGNTAAAPPHVDTRQSTATMTLPKTSRYPDSVRVSGSLLFDGAPLTARSMVVQAQKVGTTTWSQVATMTTSSTGTYAATLKPTVNTRYRVGWAGSGSRGGVFSAVGTVTVSPSMTIRASRTSFALGGTATLSTTVAPNHRGKVVTLQRWSGTSWVKVTTRTLSSTSTASASVKPPRRGTNTYRWVLPAHTDHGTGGSAAMRLRVS